MYVKHSLVYLLSKLAPALSGFVMLAAYTRWLTTEEYGIYTTILVVASSISLFTFGWLHVGILRFWENQAMTTEVIEGLITVSILGIAVLVGCCALLFAGITGERALAAGFFLVFLGSAFFEAYQRINSITQQVNRYLWVEVARTLLTLGSGLLLVWLGYSWGGAIAGVVLGVALVIVLSGSLRRHFRFSWQWLDRQALKSLWVYGLPLSLSLVLLEVIHTADRVMIGSLRSFAEAGEYAVAYNLPFQVMMMVTSSLNLAAYPVIIRVLEHEGKHAAEVRLQHYFVLLLAVSFPALLGLLGIADVFIPLLIGAEFVGSALALLPWLSVAIFANCMYLFYISLAFQLAEYTAGSVKVVGVAAVVNILLNALLIPPYGLLGAVVASLFAYLICLIYGYYLGRQYFLLRLMPLELMKITLAAGLMLLAIKQLVLAEMLYSLLARIVAGMGVYGLLAWLLNIGDVRRHLKNLWPVSGRQAKS